MSETVKREVVNIGMDFSPIQINIGDGVVWNFNPDPAPASWEKLVSLVQEFSKFKNLDTNNPEALKDIDISNVLGRLAEALGDLLLEDDQREEWTAKNYGLLALQNVAIHVIQEVSGFPTMPQSPSGED